jgi:type III secretion protein S
MTPAMIAHHINTAFMSALYFAGPILVVAAVSGLILGIFQAVTQIQDQSLGQTIKIILISILLIALGGRLSMSLVAHAEEVFSNFYLMVR